MKYLALILMSVFLLTPLAQADQAFTIDDYNASLIKVGIPFYQQYPASFYTGFAPPGSKNRSGFISGPAGATRSD